MYIRVITRPNSYCVRFNVNKLALCVGYNLDILKVIPLLIWARFCKRHIHHHLSVSLLLARYFFVNVSDQLKVEHTVCSDNEFYVNQGKLESI